VKTLAEHNPPGPDFRQHLQEELLGRCRRNPQYSLRAYARALGVNAATLSHILRGTRPLTQKSVLKLGTSLGLSPAELAKFAPARQRARTPRPGGTAAPRSEAPALQFRQVALDSFAMIADWYHDAILELMRLPDFQSDAKWVSRKLGIRAAEVHAAIERLARLGFIEIAPDGQWKCREGDDNSTNIESNDLTNGALRRLQAQILALSAKALEQLPRTKRDHTSMCMAMDGRDLAEAKERIRQFRFSLCSFLQRPVARPDQVFQLSVALFPLTQPPSEGNGSP
jgi:uncharacterized protein (TIGR02147 family)